MSSTLKVEMTDMTTNQTVFFLKNKGEWFFGMVTPIWNRFIRFYR